MSLSKAALVAASLAILIAGCSDELASPFQPNIVNQTDTFAVQASGILNVTTTGSYTWQNPGTSADVGQSGVLTSGSASLTITDVDGTTVYVSDLATTGTFSTSQGVAGTWQVQLVLTNCSGDIDFSLQTP